MSSNDVAYIVINGQRYQLEGVASVAPPPSQFEQAVLKHLDTIDLRLGALESTQRAISETLAVQVSRLDMLIWWGGLAFTVLAAVIAFVGIFAPKMWEAMSRKPEVSSPPSSPPIIVQMPPYPYVREQEKQSA